jgi:hypothetical protein
VATNQLNAPAPDVARRKGRRFQKSPTIADRLPRRRTSVAMDEGEPMQGLLSRSRPTRRGRMLIRLIVDEFDKNLISQAGAANDAVARHEIRPPKSAPPPRSEPAPPRSSNPSLN